MNIIAEYVENGHTYGLTYKPLNFEPIDQYDVVFSMTEGRSYCSGNLTCEVCPFARNAVNDNSAICQEPITKRSAYYLALFGITQDTHPEYFI